MKKWCSATVDKVNQDSLKLCKINKFMGNLMEQSVDNLFLI